MKKIRYLSILLLAPAILNLWLLANSGMLTNTIKAYPRMDNGLGNYLDQIDTYLSSLTETKSFLNNNKSSLNYIIFRESYDTRVLIGKSNWLFYDNDNSIENYKNLMTISDEYLYGLVGKMSLIENWGSENGKTIVFMIAPNKESIYGSQYLPEYIKVVNGVNSTERLINITSQSSIDIVFPKDILVTTNDEIPTYYSNDTHWNQWGAFLATNKLLSSIGYKENEKDSVEIIVNENRSGDLLEMGLLNSSFLTQDYIINHKTKSSLIKQETPIVGAFLKYEKIRNDSGSQAALFIGDSFLSSMKLHLPYSFKLTTFIHRDDFKEEFYFEDESEIIVFEIAERFLGQWSGTLDNFIIEMGIDIGG